jgi:beta-lactam-binding protein with PASTA domain
MRRLAGRLLVAAFTLLALPVVATPTASAVGESPSLSLDPADGPPGTTVTWVADGFGDCPPLDDADPVRVVVLAWDGTEIGRASVSTAGSATSTFIVPESTLEEHPVTATCLGDGAMTDDTVFTVTPPEVVQIPVPDVVGLTEDQALAVLAQEDLELGQTTGDGDTVQSQDPIAGTLADPGSTVDIDLGTDEPDTVEVPNLFGMRLDDARGRVESAGLELGGVTGDPVGLVTGQSLPAGSDVPRGSTVSVTLSPPEPRLVTVPDLVGRPLDGVPALLDQNGLELGLVTGDGTLVHSQIPQAGARVRPGSAVNVSVEPGLPPPRTVRVPDLVGDTVPDARATLGAMGLVLGETTDDDSGEITGQQPRAGTLVPAGTTVTVVLEHDRQWAALVLGAVALVLLGTAAVAAHRVLRPGLDRRWVRRHLRLAPGARPSAAGVTEPAGDPPSRTHVIRIEPHHHSGTHALEEQPP